MRSTLLRPMLAGSLLFAALAGVSAPSQAAAQDAGTVPADRHDDNGFDKGWLDAGRVRQATYTSTVTRKLLTMMGGGIEVIAHPRRSCTFAVVVPARCVEIEFSDASAAA